MDEELIVSDSAVASTPVTDPEKVDAIDNIVDILKTSDVSFVIGLHQFLKLSRQSDEPPSGYQDST